MNGTDEDTKWNGVYDEVKRYSENQAKNGNPSGRIAEFEFLKRNYIITKKHETYNDENASLREQLAKERALRKELVEFLTELLDDHKNHCFMMDFEKRTEDLVEKSKSLDDKEVK